MSFFLYPGEYLASTYRIDFDKLYDEGYRGVIFDIDNTLVPHGAPADERAIALFAHLKELGFRCILLSNNKEPRVKMFHDAVQVGYIHKAGKPKPSAYRRAMKAMGTHEKNTIFVGDQIFTDVCGANLAGIRTILVKPIHPREEIQIVCKRYLEKVVLLCYRIHVRLFGGDYPSSEKNSTDLTGGRTKV
ncbi:MAG: YqeG family HAD IIIA-type phosphatase [Muribaculaceae bacterium]|nr:YqeG family HAD IIIA-type phosphatase [Roseburia sp.]MCM1432104.1 YqeG family HAD IIIA-type phosphatase [Muribaculaceae bacterium]MCM1493971.1 YqeG family HAD IIIA-type phosphatase [Muribaculaceae bacterium]